MYYKRFLKAIKWVENCDRKITAFFKKKQIFSLLAGIAWIAYISYSIAINSKDLNKALPFLWFLILGIEIYLPNIVIKVDHLLFKHPKRNGKYEQIMLQTKGLLKTINYSLLAGIFLAWYYIIKADNYYLVLDKSVILFAIVIIRRIAKIQLEKIDHLENGIEKYSKGEYDEKQFKRHGKYLGLSAISLGILIYLGLLILDKDNDFLSLKLLMFEYNLVVVLGVLLRIYTSDLYLVKARYSAMSYPLNAISTVKTFFWISLVVFLIAESAIWFVPNLLWLKIVVGISLIAMFFMFKLFKIIIGFEINQKKIKHS